MHKFAEQILFGTRLEDKLIACHPSAPSTSFKGLSTVPDAPGRPRELMFHQGERRPFPKPAQLDRDENRGAVFHFFANHELLALELMALCLLRFPDTPLSFRQGLVRAMQEEQAHLQSYIQRMRELGVEFGTLPSNNYFWTTLSQVSSPLGFVAGMSLTFEQANLDFSLHFTKLFAQVGDQVSSEVMQKVYKDEIGHVRFGYTWFDRWNPEKADPWVHYQENLPYPLTPQRAKGRPFSVEARQLAGLPDSFIQNLNLYSHSRGRPARVFWFDGACEASLAHGPSYCATQAQDMLTGDFSLLPTFLAKADDIVVTPSAPSATVLSQWQDIGINLPHYLVASPIHPEGLDKELTRFKAEAFEPWGWSYRASQFFGPHAFGLQKPEVDWPPLSNQQILALRPLYSKTFGIEMLNSYMASQSKTHQPGLCSADLIGKVVTSLEVLNQCRHKDEWQSFSYIVVKAPWGTSGQSMKRIARNTPLNSNQQGWIERVLNVQGAVIVEPWLDRQVDLSFQIEVTSEYGDDQTDDSKPRPIIKLLDYTRMLTDHRGQYRGHRLGMRLSDLPTKLHQAFHDSQSGTSMLEHLKQAASLVGKALAERGYRGPAGIDAMIYQNQTGKLFLKPIVEVNPRYTMGRIALELESRVAAGHSAIWLHTSRKQLQNELQLSAEDWLKQLQEKLPLRMRTQIDGPSFIEQGVIPTVDTSLVKQFLAVLIVGPLHAINSLTGIFVVQHFRGAATGKGMDD